MKYKGVVLQTAELPVYDDQTVDHYVQIGPNKYLGPSGELDDYVNHSCDPNGWLRIEGDEVTLVALRDIVAGEEITFDYSTTMRDDAWTMSCHCGATECRHVIAEFSTLPTKVRQRYQQMDIVPEYVVSQTN